MRHGVSYLTRLAPGDPRFGGHLRFTERVERDLKAKYQEQVQHFANRALDPSEYTVRGMYLINDQRDFYYSHFTHGAQDEIVELAPGAPVMRNHNYFMSDPIARQFAASIAKRINPDNGVNERWVKTLYFIPTDDEGQRTTTRIDLGLFREVSIGWSCVGADCNQCDSPIWKCAHIPGDLYRGICSYGFSGVTSMLEASTVFRGGQKNTTTFIPGEGDRVLRSAFSDALGEPAFLSERIIDSKRHNQTTDDFLSGADAARAVGFGILFGKPGERSNTQSIMIEREHFTSEAAAARWVREHDFRADRRSHTPEHFVFEQFAESKAEETSFKKMKLDPGVVARTCRIASDEEQRQRTDPTPEIEEEDQTVEDWLSQ